MNFAQFAPQTVAVDRMYTFFSRLTQGLLIVGVALLPLFFIPGFPMLTQSVKSHLAIAVVVAALVTYSLAVLRRGSIALRVPTLVLAWAGVALTGVVAGLLAPQANVAFMGSQIEIHTVGFLLGSLLLMAMMGVFKDAKSGVILFYGSLCVTAVVLALIHLIRLIFGADVLSFGLVDSSVATLLGSFNDLALFFTVVILVGLIALLQLALPRLIEAFVLTAIVCSLVMLGVINFSMTWYVVGFFSLLLLMFTLTKGRIGTTSGTSQPASLLVVSALGITCLTAIVFVVGGTALGGYVNSKTGVSYLEVRPSVSATLDIMKGVYSDRMLTGAGPNHFHEAWLQHKDQSLNATLFWNTPFYAGSGYIPTWFVTSGVLGGIAWLVFVGLLFWQGVRALLRPVVTNHFWYFIATVSFTVAAFVWTTALIYVPGVVILVLGVAATGLFAVAYEVLQDKSASAFNLLRDSRTGFVLIAGVMMVIVVGVAIEYYVIRQVISIKTFASALETPADDNQLAAVTSTVVAAYNLYPNDAYVRDLSQYHLQALAALAAKGSPSPADVEQFNALTTAALEAGSTAINNRGSDARNWSARGDIYALLARLQVEGAYDRAKADYVEASKRDPQNPYYDFQSALLEAGKNNTDGARAALGQAIQKKPNYTEALSALAELDVAAGNLDEAIKTTQSLLSIEATNPGRYYQLGVLARAKGDKAAAAAAFQDAITLDPQFANARYLLALMLLEENNVEAALTQLRTVRDLNSANSSLDDVIRRLEGGESAASVLGQNTATVNEPAPDATDSTVDSAAEVPKTDLLVPVNTVPDTNAATEGQ